MTVRLTLQAEKLIEQAIARGLGHSPEEVVERALEVATGTNEDLPAEELDHRRQAVASMIAFQDEYHLRLGPGEQLLDFVREGRKR